MLSVSYSCANTFQECEFKGCLKYFAKAPKDKDYITPDYFNVGNAFHKVLEMTMHDPDTFPSINFKDILKSYTLDEFEDGGKILAMLRQYWIFHVQVPLKVIACEHKFAKGPTNGIIDAIMQERGTDKRYNLIGDPGAWWIVDLKTASKADEALPSRLHRDVQMCLYAAMAPHIAEIFKLDPTKFAGIRYREVTKPLQKMKSGESFSDWTSRCMASFREIVILKEEMDIKTTFDEFNHLIEKIHKLESVFTNDMEIVGMKNPKSCLSWGRSCEYFSVCHNATYTERMMNARVTKLENGNLISLGKINDDILSLEEFK